MTIVSRDAVALASTLVAALVLGSVAAVVRADGPPGAESLDDGMAALRAGFDALALAPLQEAVRILRAHADAADADGAVHYHLARAFEGIGLHHAVHGEQDEARRAFGDGIGAATIATERAPTTAAYHAELGNLYGNLAAQSGVIGKVRNGRLATAAFTRALELDPRNATAHVGIGIGKLETPRAFGGSTDAALAEFRAAQQLDARCDEAWIWEGIALRRRGAVAEARRAFAKALEMNPRSNHAQRELAALQEDF